MSKITKCPACDNNVSTQALACPHCGHPLKEAEQPKKRKSLTKPLLGCLGSIVLFFVFVGVLGKYLGIEPSKENTSSSSSQENRGVSREAFDKIQKGWTQGQVRALLGNPNSVSETDNPGIGKMILWHFQQNKMLGLGGAEAITIIFLNGKVHDKTWTKI